MSSSTEIYLEARIWRPTPRAFFVYYVAMAVFFLGPLINPELGLPPWLGFILGVIVAGAVIYQWNQEYHLTDQGLSKVWRWPDRRQDMAWKDIGEIQVTRGFTQTMLRVGNVRILPRGEGPEMFWFGLPNPKEVKDLIERSRP
ncbi:MAG: hypothetical protein QME75_01170 [Deltaproteobacteria bacterium]|nr:hypothetical protein [Deltaproteobacteria bacterium]